METPSTREELIEALTDLGEMGPIDRARACPILIDATKGVLARERGAAMAEATEGPDAITRAELARQLKISRTQVTTAIRDR